MKACRRAVEGCPTLVPDYRQSGLCDDCRLDEILLYVGDLVTVFRQASENSGVLSTAMTPMLMRMREELGIEPDVDPREDP